ncbi:amino acid adenylation domain-containing protein [Actinomadura sp. NAK00032]|uniref:non-ribosomal peptide synthetase n=1 Tax=Actinomadura sp. NAK00032 TaxID=2742128 RepID=UPI001591DD39|nr:non-ribosomal peptide synthetase [Actinomadura sp. NAK00032]QKW35613.1 amino acid adenylation domain-containing protein [Actinomadura sp. NAK00032]
MREPADGTVPDLFARVAAATPDAVAVVCGDVALSYRDLDARSDRIACALAGRGVGAESVVAVVLPPSAELVAALLGVLKAGAAYLPIDPGYPADRVAVMLRDTAPVLLLAAAETGADLPGGCPRLTLGELAGTPGPRVPPPVRHPDRLAYIIYTSGSSGVPKGIGATHRDLLRFATDRRWSGYARDGVLLHSPLAFDASVYQLWVPLLNGGRVVVSPVAELTPDALAKVVAEHGVTATLLISSVFNLLVEEDVSCLSGFREVWVGGERVSPPFVHRAVAACPDTVFVNGYGPTETTVFATGHVVGPAGDPEAEVPIGRPFDALRAHVLDDRLRATPPGTAGELYLAGGQLARGYLGRAGQTSGRFTACPFGPPGERMYRTGDIVVENADGELVYQGRADDQVKIRGFRIELGEIESVLLDHPDVAQAAVTVREDGAHRTLVGYVVAADGAAADPAALTRFAARRLPEFMVPPALVALDRLPLTANGKLDRAALPAPAPGAAGAHRAPRDAAETALAEVFAEVLGRARVGIDDDFLALGGDSIQAIQVVTRARARGLALGPRAVFEKRTVAALAASAAESAAAPGDTVRLAELPGGGAGWMPLLPVALWIKELGPGFDRLMQAIVLELPPGIDRPGLVATLAAVVERHDLLRARLVADGLVVDPPGGVDVDGMVRRVPFGAAWDDGAWHRALVAELEAAAGRMSPEAGVVSQFVWFDPPAGPGRLLITLHHLAVDGVTWRIVIPDLASAWRRIRAGLAPALPPAGTSARRWAHAMAEAAASPERVAELPWWRSVVDGPDPLLGRRRLDPAVDVMGTVENVRVSLPPRVTEALLTTVPAVFRGGVNDGLLACLALAVARRRRARGEAEPSTLLRLEGHGREEDAVPGADLSRTAGWFTTVFPVRLDLAGIDVDEAFAGGPAAGAAVRAVKEQLRAVPGKGVGYGLLRYLNEETAAALRPHPLGQIGFNYLGRFGAADMPEDLRGLGWTLTGDLAELEELATLDAGHNPAMAAPCELDVNATVTDGPDGPRLTATFAAPRGVLPPAELRALAGSWCAALEAVAAHAGEPGAGGLTPSDVPLATVAQDELDAWAARYPGLADVWPLTPLQSGMLHHTMLAAGPGTADAYQVQLLVGLGGAVDVARLRAAGQALLDRTAALRVAFAPTAAGDRVQLVVDGAVLPWREIRLPDGAAFDRFLAGDRSAPFDPARPPLLRMTLARIGETRTELVISAHHALFDGWSEPLLVRDLLRLYGGDSPLPERRPFRDFLAWLHRQDLAASARAHADALDGAEPTLVADGAAAQEPPGFGELAVPLTDAEAAALVRRAGGLGATVNHLVQAAWAIVLAGHTGRTDVVFGAAVAGRPPALAGVEAMVGLFLNTVPVRVRCAPWRTLADVVAGLRAERTELVEHEHAALSDVHDAAGARVLFDTLVAFQSFPSDGAGIAAAGAAAGLAVTGYRPVGVSHYPLTVFADLDDRLRLRIQHRHGMVDRATAARLAAGLARVLRAFAADPAARVAALDMAAETEPETAGAAPLPELAARRAAGSGAVLVADGVRTTLRELDARADEVADACRAHGVEPESVVAVWCSGAAERVAALLGVLRAGGCALPLDPADPPGWTDAVRADAAPAAIVTDGDASPFTDLPEIRMGEPGPGRGAAAGPRPRPRPENLAHLSYRPDEAARPRALALTHGALAAAVPQSPPDGPLAVGPDTEARELLLALCAGRTVEVRDGVPRAAPAVPASARVLGPALTRTGTGAAGEVYASGDVGRGFLGRPSLTAQLFVADPFGPPGARMFRTGTSVRRLGDDAWEHLGGADARTTERAVETVLLSRPEVARAAVVAGEGGLAGYVVAEPGHALRTGALRDLVAARLPARLVPAALAELDELPLTARGRLDRGRLPQIGAAARREPRDDREKALARLFADVLERDRIGIDDDFFACGGNSLRATRLLGRIRAELGAQVSIRSVFQYPTVAELSARWAEVAAAGAGPPRLRRRTGGGARDGAR